MIPLLSLSGPYVPGPILAVRPPDGVDAAFGIIRVDVTVEDLLP